MGREAKFSFDYCGGEEQRYLADQYRLAFAPTAPQIGDGLGDGLRFSMIQVAFAGHNRPHDLGRHGPVITGLDAAFALLKEAGVTHARLLTGLATGADELAAAAWRRADLGPIHAVLPFLDEPKPPAIGPGGEADSATWLDGAAAEKLGRNPHLKQTRMIVETADIVVVVWTGEKARGAGGTADAVLRALELGLPVLWIKPETPHPLRLIRPEQLPSDFHFPEFQEALANGGIPHVEEAAVGNLRAALALDRRADSAASTDDKDDTQGAIETWLHRTVWKTYSNFRKLVGGKISGVGDPEPLPGDLVQQPGFMMLDSAYMRADRIANRLSAVHRSEQILLILAMIAAAVVGSAWAVWPSVKLPAVWTELALAVAAVLVWASAQDAHQHERWSEQRYLAEQLRLERAGWALGVSLVSAGGANAARNEVDLGREIRRDAGLPHGRYDQDRLRRWGRWAMSELIGGQSDYHRAISVRDHRIAHRVHLVEDVSFLCLFAIFAGYVALHMVMHEIELPHWVAGVVSMTGTVVPALAAASMALESKLEFKEQSERSERIADSLDELAARLPAEPSFDELQNAARAAMRLHIAEASHWREGASRRRLFKP